MRTKKNGGGSGGCVGKRGPPARHFVDANRTAIAKELQLSVGYVSRILNGKLQPKATVAQAIAAAIGMSVGEFIDCWKAISEQGKDQGQGQGQGQDR